MNKGGREPKSRVRSGCNTCRRRRLKCDEKRPVCGRCLSSHFVCDYNLHLAWEEDALSSGRCHGRAGVWSKSSTRSSPSETYQGASGDSVGSRNELNISRREANEIQKRRHRSIVHQAFLNTTVEDMRLHYRLFRRRGLLLQDENSGELLIHNLGRLWTSSAAVSEHGFRLSYLGDPQPPLSLFPSSRGMSEDEIALMDYYKNVVCLDMAHIRRDEEHDPRQFFLCCATESRVVYLGVLMSSANLLKTQDSKFTALALKYRQKALEILRGLLPMMEKRATEIIILAIMLCSSERSSELILQIQNECDPAWVTHFAVFNDMILRRRKRLDDDYGHEYAYRLGWRYFGYHLIIAKTVCPVETLMPSNKSSYDTSARSSWTSTENLSLAMSPDTMDVIDAYSGISNRLLLLINEITELKKHMAFNSTRLHGTSREDKVILLENIRRINQSLCSLQQTVPDFIQTTAPGWVENMEKTAEATRLAVLLLLHESLRPAFFNNTSTSAQNHFSSVYDSILGDNKGSVYIKSILSLVEEVINNGPLSVSWPLWPLFIASCCTEDEMDRILILRLFKTALDKSNIGNIRPAFNVIQAVWNQRELEADNEVCARTRKRRLQRDEFVDADDRGWYVWGRIMAMMGLRVSLA